jgi:hypothetical protein
MDVNGVTQEAAAPSPVVRARAPAAPGAGGPPAAETPARAAATLHAEERAPSVDDALARQRAEVTRDGIRLRLDEATRRVIAQIVNANNEVIKQIPPEEALKFAARFRQVVGLIFDRQI